MKRGMKFLFLFFAIVLISSSFVSAAFSFLDITGKVIDSGKSVGNILIDFFKEIFEIKSNPSTQILLSGGNSITRTLPSTYTPGALVNVIINVTLDTIICSSIVTETPPAGWTITNISGLGGGTLGLDGKIRWINDGPDSICGSVPFQFALSYDATSPGYQTGTKTFSGDLDVIDTNLNIFSFVIGGATTIDQNVTSYQLIVSKLGNGNGTINGTGGINCGTGGSTCTAVITNNTVVTLTANLGNGTTFNGWSGACSGTGVCGFVINEDTNVNATFTLNQCIAQIEVNAEIQKFVNQQIGIVDASNNVLRYLANPC